MRRQRSWYTRSVSRELPLRIRASFGDKDTTGPRVVCALDRVRIRNLHEAFPHTVQSRYRDANFLPTDGLGVDVRDSHRAALGAAAYSASWPE
jgi:hypothetical protein